MEKLNELVELAKKATPGKWWIDSHGHSMVSFIDDSDMEVVFVTKSEAMGESKRHEDTGNLSHWRNDNDATFIAAANPSTILAIAEAFRALERQKESAEHERDCHMDIVEHFKENCRELVRRAEAAEEKLAELEKQKPIGRVDRGAATDSNEYPDAKVICLHEHVGWEAFQDGCELFTRPAPAVSLAELVLDEVTRGNEDVFDVGFANGFNACRSTILRKIEEAKS